MREAILLGTSHDIQRNEVHGDELRLLVNNLVEKYGVKAIAEEIRPEYDSIAKNIASVKGIEHIIIEPTLDEKKQFGIDDPGRIDMELVMRAQEPGEEFTGLNEVQKSELEQRTQKTYRQREAEWFKRIADKNIWPVLVICGTEHYEPFSSLLLQSGIEVEKCAMYVSKLK